MKKAFTLAEVLITIAIIGIVAAITIPTLVKNYKKKVIAVRLEHFAAIWRQEYRLVEFDNGNNFYGELVPANPAVAENFYKKYFAPYIKTIKTEQIGDGMTAAFPNGSGVYFYRTSQCSTGVQSPVSNCTYLIFCPYYKDCRNFKADGGIAYGEQISDGVKTFTFTMGGNTPSYNAESKKRDTLVPLCKRTPGYCSTLIERDGWVIKDDYPHKI